MKNPLIKIADAIDRFIDWTGLIAAWLGLVLVLLIATEVILRYTMSLGAVWAQELEWHLLAITALWGLSYAQKEDAHVQVDILYQHYSPRTKAWIEFLAALFIMTPISFFIAWLGWGFMMHSYDMAEISPDPGGLTHRFILKSFVTSGFLLLGIHSIGATLRNGVRLFAGQNDNNDNDNDNEKGAQNVVG